MKRRRWKSKTEDACGGESWTLFHTSIGVVQPGNVNTVNIFHGLRPSAVVSKHKVYRLRTIQGTKENSGER